MVNRNVDLKKWLEGRELCGAVSQDGEATCTRGVNHGWDHYDLLRSRKFKKTKEASS